jgi:hypothetical protein
MKIKREKLVSIWGLISNLVNKKAGVKFHYLMLKNKKILEPEVESLQKSSTPPEGHIEFNDRRVQLCNQYADKGENGEAKVINGQFIIQEQKPEFEEKMKELKEEFKEVVETMDKNQEEFQALLQEEIDIEFVKIPLSLMPEEVLGSEIELLFDIVEEDC